MATHGLAQGDLPHISAVEATNYIDQKVVVDDKVAQVALRSNVWLLHLSLKYPKSPLNVTIRREATNNFPNINDYLNQRVEITGKIKQGHGRLELAISSTNQIKIISASVATPTPVPATPTQAAIPPGAPKDVAASAPVVGTTPTVQTAPKTEESSGRTLNLILGMLAMIGVMVAAGVFILWRRPSSDSRALAAISSAVGNAAPAAMKKAPESASTDSSAEEWKERALAAEAMAGKQGQILREKMMPELTEFAKQSLVQGLYAQRNVLLETQRKAQEAVAELETRLNTMQAPLNDRIRAYEKRIAELEKEVETQGEEMRELTRATLTLVRRKLEDERMSVGGQFQSQSRFN